MKMLQNVPKSCHESQVCVPAEVESLVKAFNGEIIQIKYLLEANFENFKLFRASTEESS